MAYFKIGNVDFSPYVSGLKVNKKAVYNSQVNAAGNSIVDYINSKLDEQEYRHADQKHFMKRFVSKEYHTA